MAAVAGDAFDPSFVPADVPLWNFVFDGIWLLRGGDQMAFRRRRRRFGRRRRVRTFKARPMRIGYRF